MKKHIGIIGGGPVGVQAALLLVQNGYEVTVMEKGEELAANVLKWATVSLFSPNSLNISSEGQKVLLDRDVAVPDLTAFPTGASFIQDYLKHIEEYLASTGACKFLYRTKVVSASRGTLSKGQYLGNNPVRAASKFNVLVDRLDEGVALAAAVTDNNEEVTTREEVLLFDALIDASGNYDNPNFAGVGGLPALGERKLRSAGKLLYSLENRQKSNSISNCNSNTVTGQRMEEEEVCVVIGSGTSAITAIKRLMQCPSPTTTTTTAKRRIVWVTHCKPGEPPFKRVASDPLPQRDALFQLGNAIADGSHPFTKAGAAAVGVGVGEGEHAAEWCTVEYRCNSNVLQIIENGSGSGIYHITLSQRNQSPSPSPAAAAAAGGGGGDSEQQQQQDGATMVVAHSVYVLCGYRPDMSITRELQVHYCWASEGPMKLAGALLAASSAAAGSGSNADCLAQVGHGKEVLLNPEPKLYIIGMKSYGRNNAFLLRIGYEQAQHVLELIESIKEWD